MGTQRDITEMSPREYEYRAVRGAFYRTADTGHRTSWVPSRQDAVHAALGYGWRPGWWLERRIKAGRPERLP